MQQLVSPDNGVIESFPRGAWVAEVIDRNHPSRNHGVAESVRYMVRLQHPGHIRTSYVVIGHRGEPVYEFDPPRDCDRAAKAAIRWIRS